jgi:hypothetical protein
MNPVYRTSCPNCDGPANGRGANQDARAEKIAAGVANDAPIADESPSVRRFARRFYSLSTGGYANELVGGLMPARQRRRVSKEENVIGRNADNAQHRCASQLVDRRRSRGGSNGRCDSGGRNRQRRDSGLRRQAADRLEHGAPLRRLQPQAKRCHSPHLALPL